MIVNYKLLTISKRVAIMLLIAVFSIAGFTSCKKKVTEPSASQTETQPGETGPVDPEPNPDPEPDPNPEPEQPSFDEGTYYSVYAPWVEGLSAENGWVTNVSWQDTNTLTALWKKQIEGGQNNDGKRWFIRDAANKHDDPLEGQWAHYYYFDKDFNIVYYRQGKGSLTVRKLRSGTIVKFNKGKYAGTWAIGGIYETVLDKSEITDNGWGSLNIFMGAEHMGERGKGCLAVLTMNTSYDYSGSEFGLDHYYATAGGQEAWYNIEQYTSKTPEELDKFLNEKGNLSWNTEVYNYKFVSAQPYDWHLTDHLSQQGWH